MQYLQPIFHIFPLLRENNIAPSFSVDFRFFPCIFPIFFIIRGLQRLYIPCSFQTFPEADAVRQSFFYGKETKASGETPTQGRTS